ncbi:hypothetical protein OF83DRAFT_1111637 [Amylostereum chailletii]|nr:hypothetical protein OF83DRAFT_1111637 [Amylostereum chailletii]
MPHDSSPSNSELPYRLSFYIPLSEQRIMWILDILRREHVREMLDVGCGEGALLQPLCNPSPWLLDPHTPSGDPLPALLNHWDFAHMKHLHGLDVCLPDLDAAIKTIAPRSPVHPLNQPRWENLECKMWYGGLQTPNAAFEGIDCIVATEVVEHLPPDILPYFAPVLLGCYHPRLFLITTPSYTFNQLFHPPNSTDPWGFPDPTLRTERVFRHHDHKFEWTPEECTQWCVTEAERWGYEVVVSGVGRSRHPDPWGREAATGFASQVACFRRKEGEDWTTKRAERWEDISRRMHCRENRDPMTRLQFRWRGLCATVDSTRC